MLTEPSGPFVDISKLNLRKYAQKPALAKVSPGRVRLGLVQWNPSNVDPWEPGKVSCIEKCPYFRGVL